MGRYWKTEREAELQRACRSSKDTKAITHKWVYSFPTAEPIHTWFIDFNASCAATALSSPYFDLAGFDNANHGYTFWHFLYIHFQ